jgi:beta-phosphoglucomutase-like phosphatase (HAD superfamily)
VLLHSLKVLGWHDLRFSTLVTEGDAPANKPDPRVFGPALTSLPTVKAHEILYVGDAMTDAQAASQAGLMFIGIARDPERQAAFRNGGFQYQTTLSDIDRAVRPRELQP